MDAVLDPLRAVRGVRWSASVAIDDDLIDEIEPGLVLATASVAKLFVLVEVAERIIHGSIDPSTELAPSAELTVADSGLLHQFSQQRQRVADLALLVGAVSDNLATNVLLDLVGTRAVDAAADRLGATHCRLHDFVRDERRPGIDPPRLSSGCAGELRPAIDAIAGDAGGGCSADAAALVTGWLSANTDLSMVAAGLGLDPLAHRDRDLGLRLINKTGTNSSVRADVGVVRTVGRSASYAVIADLGVGGDADGRHRGQVLAAMAAVGTNLIELAGRAPATA